MCPVDGSLSRVRDRTNNTWRKDIGARNGEISHTVRIDYSIGSWVELTDLLEIYG